MLICGDGNAQGRWGCLDARVEEGGPRLHPLLGSHREDMLQVSRPTILHSTALCNSMPLLLNPLSSPVYISPFHSTILTILLKGSIPRS